jgi:hypothetical protein
MVIAGRARQSIVVRHFTSERQKPRDDHHLFEAAFTGLLNDRPECEPDPAVRVCDVRSMQSRMKFQSHRYAIWWHASRLIIVNPTATPSFCSSAGIHAGSIRTVGMIAVGTHSKIFDRI